VTDRTDVLPDGLYRCVQAMAPMGHSQRESHLLDVSRTSKASAVFDSFFPPWLLTCITSSCRLLLSPVSHPFSATHFPGTASGSHSCVRQLRGFCFPGSSLNPMGPSHKAAARFGSLSLLCAPRKWGKKKEKIQLSLTYMLSGIAFSGGSRADD